MRDGEMVHHVIDPRSGASACTPWVAATVVAGTATTAEPLAKAALLTEDVQRTGALLARHGACGLLIDEQGHHHDIGGIARFRSAP
jgi:thiamine biosynthesis lipoprotein